MSFSLAYESRMKNSLTPELDIFIRAAELGSFAAVAKETGITSSGVSRAVSRLENNLGASLLHRTTRNLTLTTEGESFLNHARSMVSLMDAARSEVSRVQHRPQGLLRLNCGTAFSNRVLAPLLPKFLNDYPEISVNVAVTDTRIDPIAEMTDITIRVGPLENSDLIAVPLGTVHRIIAASPEYLDLKGTPATAADLQQHNCLLLSGFPELRKWPMYIDGKRLLIPVTGSIESDSATTLLQTALAGGGIIRVGDFLGRHSLTAGHLTPVLTHCHDDEPEPITALILPGRQALPKIRVFLTFLKQHFKCLPRGTVISQH